MRCFFCQSIQSSNKTVHLEKREEQHLFKTLRAKEGDYIELIDGKGTYATAYIASGNQLLLHQVSKNSIPPIRVHLIMAAPKKQKLDIILKQCSELGVWSITPFLAERSVSIPKGDIKERWHHHLVDGCKQSKNPFLPQLSNPIAFKEMLNELNNKNWHLLFGGLSPLATPKLPDIPKTISDIAWIVGPEGGFADKEIEQLRHVGCHEITLGKWVLRTETAATAGIAVINHHYCL